MIDTWEDMNFWRSGEWQVIQERLDDLEKTHTVYNPRRDLLFSSLDETPFLDTRVAIIGQDPYPDHLYATGIAFDVPSSVIDLPPSLNNIFTEYVNDLGFPRPKNGSLLKWCRQGVLLWNATPTCEAGKPGSHKWDEWSFLTKEIVFQLDLNACVFVFLGKKAQAYCKYATSDRSICTSHPSPLGVHQGFFGSKVFSKVNSLLETPIDWRL